MALGRKGSRTIVVDGVAYRWRLRRRPTYSRAVRLGLECGWTPVNSGSPFLLDLSEGFTTSA
jgi:hypothetical protein